ncbi:hypothetical protein [Enterococcus bulliens]
MTKSKWIFIVIVACALILIFGFNYNKKQNKLIMSNPENTLRQLTNEKKGIYVFGFEACPWCQELYPVLNEVLEENNLDAKLIDIKKNNFSKADKKALNDFVVSKTIYDDTIVPLIVVIGENGFYQYHVGTVEGHNAPTTKMTDTQRTQLKSELINMIKEYKKY